MRMLLIFNSHFGKINTLLFPLVIFVVFYWMLFWGSWIYYDVLHFLVKPKHFPGFEYSGMFRRTVSVYVEERVALYRTQASAI
jgi:hypothetical protein